MPISDLDEAKYSADQLKTMLSKGQAFRNEQGQPSFPIGDEDDLQRAIKAVGRGGGDHDKIRRYIAGRARSLGKSDLVPNDWSSNKKSNSDDGDVKADKAAKPDTDGKTAKSGKGKPPPFKKVTGEAEQGEHGGDELTEVTELGEATRDEGSGRRRRIKLIQAGWSRNGRYYSAQVLNEAATARIFSAGTPMYADHPTETEKVERPERSIRDLAARLDTDARFEDDALVAEAISFGPWRPVINEIADQIGVSVRCQGEVEHGSAEGRDGVIVTRLLEGLSVDFVTDAAAGGRVLELIEAARAANGEVRELTEVRNIGAWLEACLHTSFTQMADEMYGGGRLSREERVALSSGLGDALEAFVRRVERDQPQLYKRDLYEGPLSNDTEMAEAEAQAGQQLNDVHETGDQAGEKQGEDMTESQQGGAYTSALQ